MTEDACADSEPKLLVARFPYTRRASSFGFAVYARPPEPVFWNERYPDRFLKSCCPSRAISLTTTITACPGCAGSHRHNTPCTHAPSCAIIVEVITYGQRTAGLISGSFLELAARCFAGPTHTLPRSLSSLDEPVLHRHDGLCKQFQDILG